MKKTGALLTAALLFTGCVETSDKAHTLDDSIYNWLEIYCF